MNEIPERIEREMFEIRSRMAPDVTDLRRHVEPGVIAGQVKNNIRQRVQTALSKLKGRLLNGRQEIQDSARNQIHLAGEAGKKRNASTFTDAVKSDPRPLIILAVVLAVTLFMMRRVSNSGGRGD